MPTCEWQARVVCCVLHDEICTSCHIFGVSARHGPPDGSLTQPGLQTDLAPSLAMLLGLPIPFVNIGQVHHSLLSLDPRLASGAALLQALRCNAAQVGAASGPLWDACKTSGPC